jgi:hypothetical protein
MFPREFGDDCAKVQGLIVWSGFSVTGFLLAFVFAIFGFMTTFWASVRVDDLVRREVLSVVEVVDTAANCEGTVLSRAVVQRDGDKGSCPVPFNGLSVDFERFDFEPPVVDFETLTNLSMAPCFIPPFAAALFAAALTARNFFGSRSEAS